MSSNGHNPYGGGPGSGIALPPYYKPTPTLANNNVYFPGTEELGEDEMRISFVGSCPWPPRRDQAAAGPRGPGRAGRAAGAARRDRRVPRAGRRAGARGARGLAQRPRLLFPGATPARSPDPDAPPSVDAAHAVPLGVLDNLHLVLGPVVGDRFPLEKINEALANLEKGTVSGRQLIVP